MESSTGNGTELSGNQPSPASAAQQRKSSHGAPHSLTSRSCTTCRKRKVRCDKLDPCSNCTKAGSECIYPAPGRAPRKPRQGGKVVSEREADLIKRLKRLEGVVQDLSGQVEMDAMRRETPSSEASPTNKDSDSIDSRTHTVRVRGMDEGSRGSWLAKGFRIGSGPPKPAFNLDAATQGMGRLDIGEGKSRYVASSFWASVTDEVDEIKGILEDEYDDDASDYSDSPIRPTDIQTEPNHQSFLMGYSSSDVNMRDLHPLNSRIPFYWQTYLDNVHPMTMLLHRPTMDKTLKEAQGNLDSLTPSLEALMFSIYFATITSMSKEEVRSNLGEDKDKLIKQYRFGVEQALARAGFLNTAEIVTIQAFVLFLICVRRHDDTQFVWSLTGLAIRLAQSLGIHRDGARLGLSPFDTEMRRRLWWQMCVLDLRASEDHGSDASILDFSYDTAYPTSINDDDISPSDGKPPTAREGISEMTFTLIRCEICSLLRKLTNSPPISYGGGSSPGLTLDESEALVKETSLRLEDKYLKYCEDAGPLAWVAATIARLIITKMKLFIYQPMMQPGNQMNLSPDLRDRLFISSVEILEYSRVLEEEAATKQWGWLFQTYVQWHAIAFVLGELSERENSTTVERAWRAIHGASDAWGGSVLNKKKHMLWQPMRQLMAKARRKQEQNKEKLRDDELAVNGCSAQTQTAIYTDPPGYLANPYTTDAQLFLPLQQDTQMYMPNNAPLTEPQANGMGMLAPGQAQQQLQNQQLNLPEWTIDDGSFLDMDMADLENDPNWNGWNDMLRDYQMGMDAQGNLNPMGVVPTIGGMGSWW